ncbi:MAG TPA: endonuclease/exonuclease/phosphatase family protein [Vineibacter sp.]|nr:endonuclease/exonuclease/phosphatase family protein [Vineibacter sp.]
MELTLIAVAQVVLLAAGAGVAAATIAGFLGGASPWLDYAAHFRPHLVVAAALVALAAWWLLDGPRGVVLAGAMAVLVLLNLAAMLSERRFRAPAALPDAAATVKIASANLLFLNRDYAAVQRWIEAERPDVLVLTEVTDGWAAALDALQDLYPYRAVRPTGYIAMLSRRPWRALEVVPGPRPRQGLMVARLAVGDATLSVIGAHPASPIRPASSRARDRELDVIARLARAAPGPVVAMGDFNATPWSAPMRRLVRTSPLRYADLLGTTWPTALPTWLGIKIDHIMLGNGCAVIDYQTGPMIGSDHRPVIATIRCGQ